MSNKILGHKTLKIEEIQLINQILDQPGYEGGSVLDVSRRSDRTYDLIFGFRFAEGHTTSFHLPFQAVKSLVPISEEVARETTYPEAIRRGIWDFLMEPEQTAELWHLLYKYILGQTLEECPQCGWLHRPGYTGDCRNEMERFQAPLNGQYVELEYSEKIEDSLQEFIDENIIDGTPNQYAPERVQELVTEAYKLGKQHPTPEPHNVTWLDYDGRKLALYQGQIRATAYKKRDALPNASGPFAGPLYEFFLDNKNDVYTGYDSWEHAMARAEKQIRMRFS